MSFICVADFVMIPLRRPIPPVLREIACCVFVNRICDLIEHAVVAFSPRFPTSIAFCGAKIATENSVGRAVDLFHAPPQIRSRNNDKVRLLCLKALRHKNPKLGRRLSSFARFNVNQLRSGGSSVPWRISPAISLSHTLSAARRCGSCLDR